MNLDSIILKMNARIKQNVNANAFLQIQYISARTAVRKVQFEINLQSQ